MAVYLVNQGKTYKYERSGQYIWSPKLNSAGRQNAGYNLMREVRKGDFIIHNSGGKLSAISVVKEDCKSGSQPKELKSGQSEYEWDDDGWVIFTEYYDLDVPLLTADLTSWAIENYNDSSAFQVNGKLRLQYLCNLSRHHAEYLLGKMLSKESNPKVLSILNDALSEVSTKSSPAKLPVDKEIDEKPKGNSVSVIEPGAQVYSKTYGEGTISRISDGNAYVLFQSGQRIYKHPDAFEKGYLVICKGANKEK